MDLEAGYLKELIDGLTRDEICRCTIQPLRYFDLLTSSTNRIVCSEWSDRSWPNARLGGVSVWLHGGHGLLFLGLWSGVLFQIQRQRALFPLVRDLFAGRWLAKGVAPSSLPDGLIRKYQLRHCAQVLLRADNACQRLDEAEHLTMARWISADELVKRIRPVMDKCKLEPTGLLRVRLGEACAFMRLPNERTTMCTMLVLIVYGDLMESPDHGRLLSSLCVASGGAIYDPTWNNKIDLGDPYYTSESIAERPDVPRNACPIE